MSSNRRPSPFPPAGSSLPHSLKPFLLPVLSLQPPQLPLPLRPPPPPGPCTLLLVTYPGRQRRSKGGRLSQAGVAGLRDPQASSTSGLVRLGMQQSWGTRSHLGGPQTPPYFLPSPPGDGLHWRHCWALRGSSCQRASGCERRGTAPCTCVATIPLRGACSGGGKRLVHGLAPHWVPAVCRWSGQ